MKKVLSLILVVLCCMMLFACGNDMNRSEETEVTEVTEEIDEGIELTVDNIRDYFDISAYVGPGDHIDKYFCQIGTEYEEEYLYESLNCEISFKGNPNYEFKDVVIEVLFEHDPPLVSRSFTSTNSVSIKVNLAGNGSGTTTLKTPVPEIMFVEELDVFVLYSQSGISSALSYTGYETTKVSGVAIKN